MSYPVRPPQNPNDPIDAADQDARLHALNPGPSITRPPLTDKTCFCGLTLMRSGSVLGCDLMHLFDATTLQPLEVL